MVEGDEFCFDGDSDIAIDGEIVEDLATAIRRGDRVEAELLLDRLFAESDPLTTRIQIGRYKPAARRAA